MKLKVDYGVSELNLFPRIILTATGYSGAASYSRELLSDMVVSGVSEIVDELTNILLTEITRNEVYNEVYNDLDLKQEIKEFIIKDLGDNVQQLENDPFLKGMHRQFFGDEDVKES